MSDVPEIQLDPDRPVDVEAVMRQIRAYIIAHRRTAGSAENIEMPAFDGRLDPAIYEQLYHATMVHDQISLSIHVVPSRTPIVGRFIDLARYKVHELVLYYVNQLAQKQMMFNRHLLGAVNGLVQEIERLSPAEFEALQQDVAALRRQTTPGSERQ